MSAETQSILVNGVPLLVVAGAYGSLAGAVAASSPRRWGRARFARTVLATTFASLAVAAATLGALVVYEREPLAGHGWISFCAVLVLLAPPVVSLLRWRAAAAPVAADTAEEVAGTGSLRRRELESVGAVAAELARATDADTVAHVLLDAVFGLVAVDFAAVAVVSDDGKHAHGLVGRRRDDAKSAEWWRETAFDLFREPSGVASAAFEAAPVCVYDVTDSAIVRDDLARRVGAKSAAFVPLVSGDRVIAVLAVATTEAPRTFGGDELALLQTVGGEAALALDRTRSARALERALERERLVAGISQKVRSELDLDAVLRVAVEETGRALGLARCFVRLGQPGEPLPIAAEWDAPGVQPVGAQPERLPASNLAARERRTVAIGNVATSPELDDPTLGGRETLLSLGTGSVLATPIVVFGRMIGVLALHRSEVQEWGEAETFLAEAVAREAGLAIHTARLLGENARRLERQTALLQAARDVAEELSLETVLQRLVEEVTELLRADAADCYLLERSTGTLRCAAVHGLSRDLVGFEIRPGQGLSGEAVESLRAVRSHEYPQVLRPVAHAAYEGFSSAAVAPMIWGGEVRGVLGTGTRDAERTFDDDDMALLEAFAGLAAIALRNAELFEQRSRQARVERSFSRIAAVLGEPLSLGATFEAVAQAACEALAGDFSCVLMPAGERLAVAGGHGLPDPLEARLRAGVSEDDVVSVAARERRTIVTPSVAADSRFSDAARDEAAEAGYAALAAVPIEMPRAGRLGVAVVYFRGERAFTDDDLELAGHLAAAARGALERSELFETERSSRALSQQLARSGSVVAAELEPGAILEELVERAPALLGADASSVRALEGKELVLAAGGGAGVEAAVGSRVGAASRPAGDVVRSGTPIAIADARDDERLLAGEPLLALGYAAYLGVPLHAADAFRGVLAVYSRDPREWRPEEVEALAALAANASAALANAELYQRVAQEKERSEAILTNIADGIVALDREGAVVLWNRAAERITGVAASEALGKTPAQVLQRNLGSEAGDPPREGLVPLRRGNADVWLSVAETVVRDPAGAISGRIFAFRDISAERVVEQMKEEFVSSVSHELRTPLTSIYGFAETLLRSDIEFGPEERRIFLGYIASESQRLTAIVDALLDVARVDAGDLQVELAPTDVRAVVADVVETAQANPDGHRFVVDVPEGPLEAQADADKLRQVLNQLVDNAVKYSPDGGTVTVGCRPNGETIELHVSDEGVGIPATEQERIFAKFYRGEAAAARGGVAGGAGLGLFIAQGLAGAMGGRIRVASQEGRGSTFSLALPRATGGE